MHKLIDVLYLTMVRLCYMRPANAAGLSAANAAPALRPDTQPCQRSENPISDDKSTNLM